MLLCAVPLRGGSNAITSIEAPRVHIAAQRRGCGMAACGAGAAAGAAGTRLFERAVAEHRRRRRGGLAVRDLTLPKRKRMKRVSIAALIALVAAVAAVVLGCFYLGLEFGTANSPDYSTEASARAYLASKLKVTHLSADDVRLTLKGGPKTYVYSLKDESLQVSRQIHGNSNPSIVDGEP